MRAKAGKREAPSVSQKIEAHPRLWSVVVFHGKDRRRVGLYGTKAQAEAAALGLRTFVLPPRDVWAGRS